MSTAVATKTEYTPEDLLALPDGKSYRAGRRPTRGAQDGSRIQLGGRGVARPPRTILPGAPAGVGFAGRHRLPMFPPRSRLVRKPDVSFVRYGRLPGGVLPRGWIKIRPDLAVEVVSPNDTVEELNEKLDGL